MTKNTTAKTTAAKTTAPKTLTATKKAKKIRGGNVFQYVADYKAKNHIWCFEFAGCECGPIHGRDNARKALDAFKQDYVKLLKKYHGANFMADIFID